MSVTNVIIATEMAFGKTARFAKKRKSNENTAIN